MATSSLLLDPNAKAPDLSTQKAIPTTSLGPTSLFSSSAMPVISQAATQAKTSATTALNAPPTPPKLTDGITKTDSGTYQLVHNGQIVGTYATQQQAANAGDVLGGTGTPVPTPTDTPTHTNLPQGYTAGTPDANGNTPYTNSTTGHSLTVPAGAPAGSLGSAASVQSLLSANSNYQGYHTSIASNGYINVNDASGKTAFQIDPTTAADPTAVGAVLDEHGALLSTTSSANASMASQLQALQAQHDATITQLERDKTTAEESVRSSYGKGVGSTDNAAGATSHFDDLIKQENESFTAQQSAIRSDNQTLISNANQKFADSQASISQNAQSTKNSLSQEAQQNFWTSLKNLGSVDPSTPAGAAATGQLIQSALQGGMSIAGAMGYVNLGTLASKKLDQQTFMQNVKAEMVPDNIQGMTADQAKSDTGGVGWLMQQAKGVGMSDTQALGFLQNLYQNKVQTLALQKTQMDIQNSAARVQIALEGLALRQSNSANTRSMSALAAALKPNTPLQGLTVATKYMNDIESAKDGKGPNALILTDGLVKMANGGQAIRGVQFDTVINSGTLPDKAKRALGFLVGQGAAYDDNGNLVGANVTLSADQATEIYNAAKSLAAEQIKTAGSSFTTWKAGVDSIASQDPNDSAEIYGNVSGVYDAVGQFIDTYGNADTSGGGSSAGTYNYNGTTYKQNPDGSWDAQ